MADNALARLIARVRGDDAKSNLLDAMVIGPYAAAVKDARTPFDWLSFSKANVDACIADGTCGFPFSAGGYATVTALTDEVCTPESAAQIPKKLELLFLAWQHDPVGSNEEGANAALHLALDAGVEYMEMRLCPHMHHEILNETGHEEVYTDVLDWPDLALVPNNEV